MHGSEDVPCECDRCFGVLRGHGLAKTIVARGSEFQQIGIHLSCISGLSPGVNEIAVNGRLQL